MLVDNDTMYGTSFLKVLTKSMRFADEIELSDAQHSLKILMTGLKFKKKKISKVEKSLKNN
jgi:hypothetical protein